MQPDCASRKFCAANESPNKLQSLKRAALLGQMNEIRTMQACATDIAKARVEAARGVVDSGFFRQHVVRSGQGREARDERSAAKRALLLDGSPSGGYQSPNLLQRGALL
jgi:hypothetical protein